MMVSSHSYAQYWQPLQSNVAKGMYIPSEIINPSDLKKLPIPKTNEDYAFIQAIDNRVNVVIGKFTGGQRKIVLIQDRNADGVVDISVEYQVRDNKYRYSSRPATDYPKEKFEKMKMDIINGRQGEVSPNKEGRNYIKALQRDSDRIKRWEDGFRIYMLDSDDPTSERLEYFFSLNSDGANMVFDVKYRNQGVVRVKPIITHSVYCKDSKDKFLIAQVKDMLADAAKNVPVSD